MVKCKNCYYWDWDCYDDGEEFQCCLYWFFSGDKNTYPSLQDDYPADEDADWSCQYYKDERYKI